MSIKLLLRRTLFTLIHVLNPQVYAQVKHNSGNTARYIKTNQSSLPLKIAKAIEK